MSAVTGNGAAQSDPDHNPQFKRGWDKSTGPVKIEFAGEAQARAKRREAAKVHRRALRELTDEPQGIHRNGKTRTWRGGDE
jgi:hypothetical protein